MNLKKKEQRSYCGRRGSGLVSTLLSILQGSKHSNFTNELEICSMDTQSTDP